MTIRVQDEIDQPFQIIVCPQREHASPERAFITGKQYLVIPVPPKPINHLE